LPHQFEQAYFESVYRDYTVQNPKRKLRFYRSLVERHLGSREGLQILDVGCAFGLFLESLGPRYRRFGMDASRYAVTSYRKRVPDARAVVADAARPPFAGSFDAVVAFDVLEHVPDVESALAFVRGALAADGVFVFVVPVYDGPLGPVIRLLDRDPTHVHKRSREWWLDLVGRDFEVVAWTGILRYTVAPEVYLHWPGEWMRGFAPAIAVVARLRREDRPERQTTKNDGLPH
jgi:SAM-dependent methyltransferase